MRWYGRNALPLLAERYPAFFAPHTEARGFVLTLNEIIHPEVRKLYPGAITPAFAFDASDPDRLVMDTAPSGACAHLRKGCCSAPATTSASRSRSCSRSA